MLQISEKKKKGNDECGKNKQKTPSAHLYTCRLPNKRFSSSFIFNFIYTHKACGAASFLMVNKEGGRMDSPSETRNLFSSCENEIQEHKDNTQL